MASSDAVTSVLDAKSAAVELQIRMATIAQGLKAQRQLGAAMVELIDAAGTLGKSLGSYGAFVACEHVTARYLVNSARSLVFATAPPPVAVAAAMAALELLEEQPRRVERLRDNADALRDELVPINRRYPLDALMAACADYLRAKGRRLSFEWALIDGTNDRRSDARELAELARSLPLPAHVNLIPLNPTPGSRWTASRPQDERAFVRALESHGVPVTVRDTRGQEIDGACGQLAAAEG